MDKIIELAKQAGAVSYTNRHYPDRPYRTFGPEELQKFYTLARADLEAENAKLKELLKQTTEELQYGNPRDIETDTYRYDNDLIHAARAALGETK